MRVIRVPYCARCVLLTLASVVAGWLCSQRGANSWLRRARRRKRTTRTSSRRKIRPLLAANCFACHGESAMAGLRVDSREGLLRGGETGPAIVPGNPEKSTLLKAVQHADGFPRMPRGRAKLPQADIDAIAEWVRARRGVAARPRRRRRRWLRTSARSRAEQRAFWAFQPIRQAGRARRAGCRVAAHRHRSLRARASRTRRPEAGRQPPTS